MMPLLPLPLLFGREDDAFSTHADSSPAMLAHVVCRALKAHVLLDRPLPASPKGGKDSKGDGGNNNGDVSSGGQEVDPAPDQDGLPLPPP